MYNITSMLVGTLGHVWIACAWYDITRSALVNSTSTLLNNGAATPACQPGSSFQFGITLVL